MIAPTRIFVLDDNLLLLEGLCSLLDREQDITVVGSATSGAEAVARIEELRPDVALVDIAMPEQDGLAVTRALRKAAPDVRIIILGLIDSAPEIMAYIEAGIAAYSLKETSYGHLVETIRTAMRGEFNCTPQMATSLFSRIAELASEEMVVKGNSTTLTERELEILQEVAQGLTNKDIGERLFIGTQTVKNHIHNILDKLSLHNRLEAVTFAREQELL